MLTDLRSDILAQGMTAVSDFGSDVLAYSWLMGTCIGLGINADS